jgi:hypothetical protein
MDYCTQAGEPNVIAWLQEGGERSIEGQEMVTLARVELATFPLGGGCSIQLSYKVIFTRVDSPEWYRAPAYLSWRE